MVLLDASGNVPDTSIGIYTRAGKSIDNTQSWQLSRLDWKSFSDLLKEYSSAKKISEPCPVYNCHGLTFGSRRSSVTDDIFPILKDDGFVPIDARAAREGDVIVYLEDGGVIHTGFIIEMVPLLNKSSELVPRVWSKWGKGPEMIHRVGDCDFYKGEENVLYFRLQAWEEGWKSL